jgi:putative hydrolase of the HAD superfamily
VAVQTRIKAVVFDLDDTLISAYRRPDLVWRDVCQAFRHELGELAPDRVARALTDAGQAFWGDPVRHALGRADPLRARRTIAAAAFSALRRDGVRVPAPDVAERLADAFSVRRDDQMHREAGALALLTDLQKAGYRLALLTNGDRLLQRAKIERFGLAPRFHHVQIEGEAGIGKPEPGAFSRVFAALGVGAAEVCVVGDSVEWDIRPAKALGCYTIRYDPEPGGDITPTGGEADWVVQALATVSVHLSVQAQARFAFQSHASVSSSEKRPTSSIIVED